MHRHKKTISFFILISIVWFFFSWKKEDGRSNEDSIRQWIIEEMVSMQSDLDSIAQAVSAGRQIHFYHEARMHYKHLEFFIEFYSRNDARFYFNGPLVPKYEPDFGNTMLPPHGFQRIEEIIYSGIPDTALNDEIKILKERLERAQYYYSRMVIKDGDLIKLCQLELFRIASMNLNGYDASISQTAMQETVWAIDGMEKLLSFYEHYAIEENKIENAWSALLQQLALAKSKLLSHPDYNTFNRLDFIVDNINPLNKAFINFHKLLGQEWNNTPLVLQLNSEFLFGEESLNTQIYYLDYLDTSNLAQQIALGKKLFYKINATDGSLWSSADNRKWETVKEGTWEDKSGKLLKLDGKELKSSTNGTDWALVIDSQWEGSNGIWYKFDPELVLWFKSEKI